MTKEKRKPESTFTHLPEATITLADYVASPRNYNTHSEDQITKLRASLRKFGQVKNIVVWRNMFVAGHGLAQAATLEGWTTLRANVIPEDWPEQRVLAYLAADNELARQSDPDQAALAALIDEVAQFDHELMLAIGYSDEEFAKLLAEVGGSGENGESGSATSPEQANKTLAERFIIPPFSVLDARQGYWQDRKRAWIALGIQSELGRGENALGLSDQAREDGLNHYRNDNKNGGG